MNYYTWRNLRNFVGWAAECARLALSFYRGDRRDVLDAVIAAVERFARGETIDHDSVDDNAAWAAARGGGVAAANAAWAASNAARSVATGRDSPPYGAVDNAVAWAQRAGVPQDAIDLARWRWIVRDLAGDRALPHGAFEAAIAAVSIGRFELAREILHGTAEAVP